MSPRVLIVDDHDAFRTWARRILVADGYDVVGEAADGSEALTKVGSLRPDLALVDIQLPGIDGFEVARLLALAEAAPTVVLVSSREAVDYGGLVEESPARGFLTKGEISGESLTALLRQPG
jgi:DNA-binding NarL/FixJ family response regulator